MIEAMKKLEVILRGRDSEDFLLGLQRLGHVHLEGATGDSPGAAGTVSGDEGLSEEIARIREAADWSSGMARSYGASELPAPLAEEPGALARRLLSDRKRLAELDMELRVLENRITRLEPYGRLDPELFRKLGRAGLALYLCRTTRDRFLPEGGAAVGVERLGEDEDHVYFLALHLKSEGLDPRDQEILTAHDELPLEDLAFLEAERGSLRAEQEKLVRGAVEASRHAEALRHEAALLGDRQRRASASAGLESALDGEVKVARGWFPADREREIRDYLDPRDTVYFIDGPGREDDVPIKLRHNGFSRLFEPITRVYDLPNYNELDTTPFFAPFYALFFGLCVADGGYALLLLLAIGLGYGRLRKSKAAPMLGLAAVLALATLAGGIVLDDWFGLRPVTEGLPGYEWLGPLAFLRGQDDAMYFPIMLGFIQIALGYILRTINRVRHSGWVGALLSLGTLAILAGLVMLILRAVGPSFAVGPIQIGILGAGIGAAAPLAAIGAGVLLMLFFNGVEHGVKWYKRPLHGLWNLYELATGLPGDILSYTRLFALGLAGGLLAEAVNGIALGLTEGTSSPLAFTAMILVLLVGHGLNLGIGLLSAFVHSLRLTFVEFYKAVEFKGGGRGYKPFALEASAAPDFRLTASTKRR